MDSIPSLPGGGPLRPFVIWASVGVCCLMISIGIAIWRRKWSEVRIAAIPPVLLAIGLSTTHFSNLAHTYSTWITVIATGWAAYRTSEETSAFLFLGGLGLGAAGVIASTQLF